MTKAARITVLTPGGVPADFTLSASPASLTIVRDGASASTAITIDPTGGFDDPITLSVTGVPAGVSVTPAAPVTVGRNAAGFYPSTSFTFAASATAAPGNYTITVTGTGGGISRSTTLTLRVKRQ